MDAVIIAGGIPQPGEKLYAFTLGKSKALLDVAGKAMTQWVIDALEDAETIDRVILIGVNENSGLTGRKLCAFLPNQGGMLDNIQAGIAKVLEFNPAAEHVLLASSDIPAITAEMVDWVTKAALDTGADICYNVITRQTMEARYPASHRTYMRLKDYELCGGDMNVVRTRLLKTHNDLAERLIAARKSPLKQASIFGLDTVLLIFLRQLSLHGAVARVSKRLGLKASAVVCPYAEVGMDVDKPHQLELLRADLEGQR
ncbi:MAG: nucleotidyltransferase family protein [Chloroflexota bacterium]